MSKSTSQNLPKNISLVNACGDNFGDFLNLSSTIEILRSNTNFEIVGIHYSPQQWSHQFPLGDMENLLFNNLSFVNPKTEIYLHLLGRDHDCPNNEYWLELNKLTMSSDFVLSVPSGQSIGPYQNWAFLSPFVSALRNKKPFGMLFGTAHLSGDTDFDSISSFILSLGSISIRDRVSAQFLKSLGIKCWGPADSSYLYARKLNAKNSSIRQFGEYICLILGDSLLWHPKGSDIEGSSTVDSLAFQIAKTILDASRNHDTRVVLLAHSPLESEVLRLKEISNALGGNLLVIEIKTLQEYVSWINGSALVVSLRYHGALLAISNLIPTIAIAYEAKTSSFMQENKLEKWCISLEDYSSLKLKDLFNAIWGNEDFSFHESEDESGLSILDNFLIHIESFASSPKQVFNYEISEIYQSIYHNFMKLDIYDSAIADRDSAIADRDSAIADRDSAIADRDSILHSDIWKATKPYRWLRDRF